MGMNRGVCQVCGFKYAVTKAGTMVRHHRLRAGRSMSCAGVGLFSEEQQELNRRQGEHFARTFEAAAKVGKVGD